MSNNFINWVRSNADYEHFKALSFRTRNATNENNATNLSSSSSSHRKKIEWTTKCKALLQENGKYTAFLMLFHFPGGRFL